MGFKARKRTEIVCSYYHRRAVVSKRQNSPVIKIEVVPEGIKLFIPPGTDYREILRKHGRWIRCRIDIFRRSYELSEQIRLEQTAEGQFKKRIKKMVDELSGELKVPVKRVCCRYMKTKWGSWSSKGVLTLNKFLRFLPENLIRYVVIHELLHYHEPYHDENFYNLMAVHASNYEELDINLMAYWICLQKSGYASKYLYKR